MLLNLKGINLEKNNFQALNTLNEMYNTDNQFNNYLKSFNINQLSNDNTLMVDSNLESNFIFFNTFPFFILNKSSFEVVLKINTNSYEDAIFLFTLKSCNNKIYLFSIHPKHIQILDLTKYYDYTNIYNNKTNSSIVSNSINKYEFTRYISNPEFVVLPLHIKYGITSIAQIEETKDIIPGFILVTKINEYFLLEFNQELSNYNLSQIDIGLDYSNYYAKGNSLLYSLVPSFIKKKYEKNHRYNYNEKIIYDEKYYNYNKILYANDFNSYLAISSDSINVLKVSILNNKINISLTNKFNAPLLSFLKENIEEKINTLNEKYNEIYKSMTDINDINHNTNKLSHNNDDNTINRITNSSISNNSNNKINDLNNEVDNIMSSYIIPNKISISSAEYYISYNTNSNINDSNSGFSNNCEAAKNLVIIVILRNESENSNKKNLYYVKVNIPFNNINLDVNSLITKNINNKKIRLNYLFSELNNINILNPVTDIIHASSSLKLTNSYKSKENNEFYIIVRDSKNSLFYNKELTINKENNSLIYYMKNNQVSNFSCNYEVNGFTYNNDNNYLTLYNKCRGLYSIIYINKFEFIIRNKEFTNNIIPNNKLNNSVANIVNNNTSVLCSNNNNSNLNDNEINDVDCFNVDVFENNNSKELYNLNLNPDEISIYKTYQSFLKYSKTYNLNNKIENIHKVFDLFKQGVINNEINISNFVKIKEYIIEYELISLDIAKEINNLSELNIYNLINVLKKIINKTINNYNMNIYSIGLSIEDYELSILKFLEEKKIKLNYIESFCIILIAFLCTNKNSEDVHFFIIEINKVLNEYNEKLIFSITLRKLEDCIYLKNVSNCPGFNYSFTSLSTSTNNNDTNQILKLNNYLESYLVCMSNIFKYSYNKYNYDRYNNIEKNQIYNNIIVFNDYINNFIKSFKSFIINNDNMNSTEKDFYSYIVLYFIISSYNSIEKYYCNSLINATKTLFIKNTSSINQVFFVWIDEELNKLFKDLMYDIIGIKKHFLTLKDDIFYFCYSSLKLFSFYYNNPGKKYIKGEYKQIKQYINKSILYNNSMVLEALRLSEIFTDLETYVYICLQENKLTDLLYILNKFNSSNRSDLVKSVIRIFIYFKLKETNFDINNIKNNSSKSLHFNVFEIIPIEYNQITKEVCLESNNPFLNLLYESYIRTMISNDIENQNITENNNNNIVCEKNNELQNNNFENVELIKFKQEMVIDYINKNSIFFLSNNRIVNYLSNQDKESQDNYYFNLINLAIKLEQSIKIFDYNFNSNINIDSIENINHEVTK